jgi:ATP-binding cassette, subfamily B, bacterial PglK
MLLFLMVISSFFEVISIGLLIPFFGALSSPEELYNLDKIQPFINYLNIQSPGEIILPLTIIFISAALFSGIIRITLLYYMTNISFSTGTDLSIDIFEKTLYQEYLVHVQRNSSEVINGMSNKTNLVINNVIRPVLNLLSAIVLVTSILIALLVLNTVVTTIVFMAFGSVYLLITKYSRKKISNNSENISINSTLLIKTIQEGLGGIRDVLINQSQKFFCKLYQEVDISLRKAQGSNIFISASPRYVMEALSVSIIAYIAYYIVNQEDTNLASALAILGVLALSAQKILPSLQQIYSSITLINGSKHSLNDILKLLDQPKACDKSKINKLTFDNKLTLKDVSFRYSPDTEYVLKNVNLEIEKGCVLGVIGSTGSGKSTVIDIISGLLIPSKGEFLMDDVLISRKNVNGIWAKISYVPQNIFLTDGSIKENIAFGIPKDEIDMDRVYKATRGAYLSEVVEKLNDKYETVIGESGTRLSGGQRQRIGIARALYRRAEIIIFDEATSALDSYTEKLVMNSINSLDDSLTIIIIAHRLTTLSQCSEIIELRNKRVSKVDISSLKGDSFGK